MKIEKLNDNQIRCTLTHADLGSTSFKAKRTGIWHGKSQSLFQRYDAAGIFLTLALKQKTSL